MYISAIQNKLYRKAIKNCKLPIICVGEEQKETVISNEKIELMLNCLHDFLNRETQ